MKLRSSRVIGKHCLSVTTLSLPTTSNMTSIKSQALNGNENESVLLRSSAGAGDVQSVTSLHASRACEVATCSNQISIEHDNADPLNAAGNCKEQAAQLHAFPGHSSQTHILSRSSDDLDQGRVATSLHASSACEVATSYEQISTEHGNGDYISRGVDSKGIGYQRVSVNPGLVSSCRVDMGEGGRHVSRPTQSVSNSVYRSTQSNHRDFANNYRHRDNNSSEQNCFAGEYPNQCAASMYPVHKDNETYPKQIKSNSRFRDNEVSDNFQQAYNHDNEPKIRLPSFDGKCSWESFHIKFEIFMDKYDWGPRKQLEQLLLCLTGEALTYTSQLTATVRSNINQLIAALKRRFGDHSLPETERANLQTLRKSVKESLPEYASRVMTMVMRAYPGMEGTPLFNELTIEHLVCGLPDPTLVYDVLSRKPKTIDEAIDMIIV